jgi:hypothetical protein
VSEGCGFVNYQEGFALDILTAAARTAGAKSWLRGKKVKERKGKRLNLISRRSEIITFLYEKCRLNYQILLAN